jgi:hypothetical protein
MHTMGEVAIVFGRSMKSTWIIDTPRWLSHSAHAATHDRQPMQREGSMRKL